MKNARNLSIGAVLLLFLSVQAHADFSDDFNDGNLDGWTTDGFETLAGDFEVVSGVAVLADGTDSYGALYQGIPLGADRNVLEFDVFNGLSDVADLGIFYDTFFASVYFVDDLSLFDLTTLSFDDEVPLFNMDSSGFFDVFFEIELADLGSGWTHVTYEFDNSFGYAIPTFELVAQNFIYDDSTVGIDNVSIAVVPEPSTTALIGLGMAIMFARRRMARS